jgi:WS/DGAT/MGAT family acyltransferase
VPPRHLDRLSALDASFLHLEGADSHMHIGALALCDGPAPELDELLAHVVGRLDRVPRYRQRLAHTALDRGRPLWVDDPDFSVEEHVRHTALAAPGDRAELLELVARVFSTQLDRRRPLWELWFVEGLAQGGFALIFKSHHALIDGIAGVDLATVVFDLDGVPPPPPPPLAWRPQPNPGTLGLVALAAAGVARATFALGSQALGAARSPAAAARHAGEAVAGLGAIVGEARHPAPHTPLNVAIGPDRRFAVGTCRLEDVRLIKHTFGGTVNDVLLSAVTGVLRRFLHERGVRTEGLELRALVPVSIRAKSGRGESRALGNRLTAMRAPLPVHLADPLARLEAVRASMADLKRSRQALGVEVLARVGNFAPPGLLAHAARRQFTTRLFNLLVTNVPGPQVALGVLGRRIREAYPIALLPPHHALSVAILSYDGAVSFGLLADYDALPEVELLAGRMAAEVAELVRLARSR